MTGNQALYGAGFVNEWANKEGLQREEQFFIEKYLARPGKTLEAGTGGGRIVLAMQQLGFESLHGFDYLPEMIDRAKQRDTSGRICFDVQDATQLPYADASFDQVVYMQQILCMIGTDEGRRRALREAWRILKPGGAAVFSFLSFAGRSGMHLPFISYLRVLRRLRGTERPMQYLPLLRLDGRINFPSLLDREPHVYWYRPEEAWTFLESGGFTVLGAATGYAGGHMPLFDSRQGLMNAAKGQGLYFACAKN